MSDLRETIAALTDKAEAGEPLTEVVETPVVPSTPVETAPETQVEGRTAGRSRDEKGRLLPGKVETPVSTEPRVRPSSWKKEMWESFDKLEPTVADYINQRESEYAKGVSTYKTEWEQAKPYLDAITPHLPDLQKAGINPAYAISRLANTHSEITKANPMGKLQIFTRLAQEYGVPIQALYDPQFAQQYAQQQPQQQQQTETPEAAARRVYSEIRAQEGVHEFGLRKNSDGSPMYPHYETVRGKMAQLLESGLAEDLEGAYKAAVKLDDNLFQSIQAEKSKAEEAKKLEDQRKAVQAAKSNAISPKSSTPASTGAGAQKGLRSSIEAAFEQHTGGRV